MSDGQAVENNSATAVAEPSVGGQSAPASVGTLESQSGQAGNQGQGASTEDSFTTIDPKTLPPELQAVYKSLQSDYTKKQQAIADARKKAEAYEKLSTRPDFKDFLNGATKAQKAEYQQAKAEAEKRLGEKITDEEFQKGLATKDDFLELIAKVSREATAKNAKEIEELKQYKQVTEASNLVEAFATEKGKDGQPLRPDFYSLDEDQLISGFMQINANPNMDSRQQLDLVNQAYTWAKQVSQKYYEKGKAEALQIISKKAQNSTEPPTTSAKGAYTGPPAKNLTAKEAIELAKKGIRVPRED